MTQIEALLITLAIELLVAFAWFVVARWLPRPDWWRGALVIPAASLLSHPLAWQASTTWLRALPFAGRAAIIEVVVAVVEAVILAVALPLGGRRAVVVAVTMNAASFGVGLAIFYLR